MFVTWLIFCALASIFAASRGRNPFVWFVISFFLSPLIGALLLALMPKSA